MVIAYIKSNWSNDIPKRTVLELITIETEMDFVVFSLFLQMTPSYVMLWMLYKIPYPYRGPGKSGCIGENTLLSFSLRC